MTHSLYRSQENAPSEAILGDSRGSVKQMSIPTSLQDRLNQVSSSLTTAIDYEAAEASHPGFDRQFDRQNRAHSLRYKCSDDPTRLNVSRIVWVPLQQGF